MIIQYAIAPVTNNATRTCHKVEHGTLNKLERKKAYLGIIFHLDKHQR